MRPASVDVTPSFDVFLDLTDAVSAGDGLDRYLSVFQSRVRPAPGRRITAAIAGRSSVLRDGQQFDVPATTPGLAHAFDLAQLDGRGLLIIAGAWIPQPSAMSALTRLATLDPNIGTIQPRFAVGGLGDLLMLPDGRDPPLAIPRELAALLPEFHVTPEIATACVYFTPRGVLACGEVRPEAGPATMVELEIGLRRRGFRNLVANRVVVDYPLSPAQAYRSQAGVGLDPTLADDLQAGADWLMLSPAVKFERLLSGGMSGTRRRLLLDCRGMIAAHNGSAHAILGYLLGISRHNPATWEITVCVGRAAAQFHDLTRRFPDFRYEYDRLSSKYLVAIHLSQPWSLEMFVELHESAPLVAFNILDTIAWDAIYPAPAVLDSVTRLAARFADGLTYLSRHSQERFRFRFPPHERMREAVTYLSMSPVDYGSEGPQPARQAIGILVVGNRLDHKDVTRTADKLAEAFPYTPIVAFGSANGHSRPNIRSVPSGLISDANVRDMLERASVIVYPSFSEGFGIPVVQGLALGKTVVARDLPLWDEIRLRTRADARLRTFRTDAELVDAVGQALEDANGNSSATAHDAPAFSWYECAGILLDFADDLVDHFAYDQWQSRDLALASGFHGRA